MIPDLIVRADAGPNMGLGHVVRSAALAEAWRNAGGAAFLVTAAQPGDIPSSTHGAFDGITKVVRSHPNPVDLATLESLIRSKAPPWVSCDGYHFDAAYTGRLRKAGARVLVVDDEAHQSTYDADVLLNQNLGSENLSYRFDRPTITLLGPRFALLAESFVRWREWSRVIPDRPACLLLTVGGGSAESDGAAILARACAVVGSRHAVRTVVLAGPRGAATLSHAAGHGGPSAMWETVSNPSNVSALMAAADIAVSAAGSTVWQLCFMGLPSLLTPVAANQSRLAAGLDEAGCAIDLGWHSRLTEGRVVDALEHLFADRGLRAKISTCGRALVDGMGAARVAAALLEPQRVDHERV